MEREKEEEPTTAERLRAFFISRGEDMDREPTKEEFPAWFKRRATLLEEFIRLDSGEAVTVTVDPATGRGVVDFSKAS